MTHEQPKSRIELLKEWLRARRETDPVCDSCTEFGHTGRATLTRDECHVCKGWKLIEPEYADKERCLRLRRNSKRGHVPTIEELTFCDNIRRKFPEWYHATEPQIYEETKPFGA